MDNAICKECGKAKSADSDDAPCLECATPIREEHRGSRMPDLIREAASDPLFHDAAFREFEPDTAGYRSPRALDEDLVQEAPREPIDRMFQEAAASGFEPLTEEQAADFREKLRGASVAIHGGRR